MMRRRTRKATHDFACTVQGTRSARNIVRGTTYEVRRREARDRTSNEFVTCVVSRRHAVRLLPVRNIHQR